VPLDPSFWIEEPEPFDWKTLRHLAKNIRFDWSIPPGRPIRFLNPIPDMVSTVWTEPSGPIKMTPLKNREGAAPPIKYFYDLGNGNTVGEHVKGIIDKKIKAIPGRMTGSIEVKETTLYDESLARVYELLCADSKRREAPDGS